MKRVWAQACACALSLFFCISGSASWDKKAEEVSHGTQTSHEVLLRAYLLGKQLAPEERGFELLRAAQVAVTQDSSLGKQWSEELFRRAFDLPLVWNRLALEKNALTVLSQVDAHRAMKLFPTMDSPIAMPDGSFPEDVRAHAARTVFLQYWQQTEKKGLPQIRSTARYVGETGQYPFAAMGLIIQDLAHTNSDGARSLFMEAVGYYRGGSRFRSEDFEYVEFLKSVRNSVDAHSMHEGLQKAVSSFTENRSNNGKEEYFGRAVTKSGSATFNSPQKQLLFDVFYLINEVDPAWATRLQESKPELAVADSQGVVSEETAATFAEGKDAAAIAQGRQEQFDWTRAWTVRQIGADKPDEAIQLALSISDPSWRSVALSSLATVSKQPTKSDELLRQGRELLSGLKDREAKLRALAAYAEGSASSGRSQDAQEAIDEAFPIGEELFQEDLDATPGILAYDASGYTDLVKLTQIETRLDPSASIARIDRTRNTVLRANLMVEAASGLAERERANRRLSK